MDIKVGNDEELFGIYSEDFLTQGNNRAKSSEEDFFKRDEIKLMGLKSPKGRLPNGSKIDLVEEKNKATLYVAVASSKRVFEIDLITGEVKEDGVRLTEKEIQRVLKILNYFKKNCNFYNSETKIMSL
ncbi:MAG: hypothetical protein DKM50_11040 [Candidatus Margulisiibacteriota bacterium]|nr:MAG: hypothetical protein A2X43_07850 [Candidatus Margulisbacteria bacterium GWD2_39_127]OGI04686.1 MAG: hypothetical protein A2X42_11050 [Candidatus Margulisbacteria bacterium GWF2_38_17]PZM78662.1 MAG: hypothetical protein DKM50_11040 [Candidatus Margulisiibacteriota bacterium]HAR62004.1 hypothetical protein [Candidatus Margulisiibacteriota bacterium]HCT86278.1 hypothetical protein [Candidatus Margulisiibacteriota bacterium]